MIVATHHNHSSKLQAIKQNLGLTRRRRSRHFQPAQYPGEFLKVNLIETGETK